MEAVKWKELFDKQTSPNSLNYCTQSIGSGEASAGRFMLRSLKILVGNGKKDGTQKY